MEIKANNGVQGTAHKVRCPLTPDVGAGRFWEQMGPDKRLISEEVLCRHLLSQRNRDR